MANFDYLVDSTETQLTLKVATFAFGIVNLVLNKTALSQQEADQLTSQLTEHIKQFHITINQSQKIVTHK